MCCECGGGQKEWAVWAGQGAANPVLLGAASPSWASIGGSMSFQASGLMEALVETAVAAALAEYIGAREANVHVDASPIARRLSTSDDAVGGVSAWSATYDILLPSEGFAKAAQLVQELADQIEAAQQNDTEEIDSFVVALVANLAESAGVDASSFVLQSFSQPEGAVAGQPENAATTTSADVGDSVTGDDSDGSGNGLPTDLNKAAGGGVWLDGALAVALAALFNLP